MGSIASGSARELIEGAAAQLRDAGVDAPRLDAELLLAAVTGRSRTDAMFGAIEIDALARSRFDAMIDRRARREPLAYIIGRKEFYSIEFEVTPRCLSRGPRPKSWSRPRCRSGSTCWARRHP